MKYLSVCSGIEAATMAWHPLGWTPWAFSEIEPFPCAVLAHHYPNVPNLGDMTKFEEWPDANIDVLCGGTPCQSFSVAGLRKGLDDPRGNLMLTFAAIAAKYRPRWVVWENVPGVLSSSGGRDFASLLGILSGRSIEPPTGGWQNTGVIPGINDAYGLAWRVLDAQYVRVDGYGRAVPQRRRRVFVIGYLGDWRRAAAVLLERESLSGHPPPSRGQGARVAACLTRGAESSGRGGYAGRRQEDDYNIVATDGMDVPGVRGGQCRDERGADEQDDLRVVRTLAYGGNNTAGPIDVATACNAHGGVGRMDFESETFVAQTLRARDLSRGEGFDASEDGTGRGIPPVVGFHGSQDPDVSGDVRHPAGRNQGQETCVAYGFQPRIARNGRGDTGDIVGALNAQSGQTGKGDAAPCVALSLDLEDGMQAQSMTNGSFRIVRRLTPRECERLQGFPDDFTRIPWRGKPAEECPDGPRYKAIGNSWAVNCARWIGRRIERVEAIE